MNNVTKYAALFAALTFMPFALHAQENADSSSDSDYYSAYEKCEGKADSMHGDDSEEVRDAFISKCLKKEGFESHMEDEDGSSEDFSDDSDDSNDS